MYITIRDALRRLFGLQKKKVKLTTIGDVAAFTNKKSREESAKPVTLMEVHLELLTIIDNLEKITWFLQEHKREYSTKNTDKFIENCLFAVTSLSSEIGIQKMREKSKMKQDQVKDIMGHNIDGDK